MFRIGGHEKFIVDQWLASTCSGAQHWLFILRANRIIRNDI